MKYYYFLIVLFFLILCSELTAQNKNLRKVTFLPHWVPQTEFAGYYVAKDLGIYEKHGIDCEILTGSPDKPASKALENKKVDFITLFLTTGIERRANGVKLVNIYQSSQRSSVLFVAKKSSGIKSIQDINNKKVGIWRMSIQEWTKAFLKKHNLNVEIIPIEQTINLFLLGGIDVMAVMWNNEYHKLLNAGLNPDELVTFFFSDYGMNFPEDGLYCLEETYMKNPELACDFVNASIEGWKYAFENPEKAIDIVMRYKEEANRSRNRSNQRWMLNRTSDLMMTKDGKGKQGILLYDDYQKTGTMLMETGSIKSIPDFKSFYKGCIKNVTK